MTRRVLVVGGAGAFGSRLVEGLLATTDLEMVVAGRSLARLAASSVGRVSAVVMDAATCSPEQLTATGCFIVVDMAGPFQAAGYGLAAAAVAAHLHYVDIADSRSFVAGFGPALDASARNAGVILLTGASSTPALSNAALDEITKGWTRIDAVSIDLSPGNRAPRGRAVVRAILSYAGQKTRLWRDGAWREQRGWGMTRRASMPGLGARWLSLCDTPDLDIVPARFGVRRSVVFRAGLELSVLHLGLLAATLPVRVGLVRSLAPLADAVRALAGLLAWCGTDKGGMVVTAAGQDRDDDSVVATWHLVAEDGDGPIVPTLPALATIRAIAAGRISEPGARPCVGELTLAEIEAEMRAYRITTGVSSARPGAALFRRALGTCYVSLPAAVRALHEPGAWMRFTGSGTVLAADTPFARLVAALFRFPPAAVDVPVTVTIDAAGPGEIWTRNFDGRKFRSHLTYGGTIGRMVERFGPFRFDMLVEASSTGVRMRVVGWRIGPLRLPRFLAPLSDAHETVDDAGCFRFDVPIDLPFRLGRVVQYTGTLRPEPASPS